MLEYITLAILIMGLMLAFYTFVYIHDIPYEIAKHRNHPQKEAIHAACWLSLVTLHAIWPIVFIWAISKQRPEGVVVADDALADKLAALEARLAELERRGGSEAKGSA
jgi:fatty acid desaturase